MRCSRLISQPLSLLTALALAATAGCSKPKETSQEPAPGGAAEVSAEPVEEAPPLVDTWYNDVNGDGIPDFVELELSRDPNIDECIVTACGEKARGGELAERINTLVILDVSGSMAGKIGKAKKTKMAAAKEAVQRFVEVMPKAEVMHFGLMAFGHLGDNTAAGREESCSKVEMMVPLGAPEPKAVASAMAPLKPTGWSPIARAIEASAEFLPAQVSAVNHVILVADGIERCDGDPATVARQLFQTNRLTVIDVVGFGVEAREDVEALRAIAETTGGRYVDAGDAAAFDQAFNELTVGTWGIFDTWLCAVSSAPLLECYEERAAEAIARTTREIEFMSRYSGGEDAIATLEKIKTRIGQTMDDRKRVVTTYKVNVDTIRAEQEMLRAKALGAAKDKK